MKQTTQFHTPPHDSLDRLTFDLQRFSAFSGGDGSKDNPYQIKTVADLQQLATDVNGGNNYSGVYFKLMGTINMSGVNFAGIGNKKMAFSGTFDGYGNTISNLTINKAGGYRLGLFGYTDGATIQNVNVTNVNITASGNLGAVVGLANNSIIDNCAATGSISGTFGASGWVGGLIGRVDDTSNTITNCKADVQVSGGVDFNALFGWIDPAANTISGCYYRGEEEGYYAGITRICKLTIPDDLTASGKLVEFGGNTYAAQGTEISLKVNDNSFYKVTGISGAIASGDNYTCTVGTSDVTFKLEGFPKIGSLGFEDTTNTYTINTLADLQALANYVNQGNTCEGLKFKLTADISGVNFHIGTSASNFKGTFDGDGYKITVNYNSTTENCALFNYVDGATIQYLTVDGTINTSAKYAAGFVAQASGSVYIYNCTSSVTIDSTVSGDGTHGGFVGVSGGTLTISNSIFNGSLLGSATNSCGGFVGWNNGTINIIDSVFAPSATVTINTAGSSTFARGNNAPNLSNGYYTQAFGTAQGTQVYTLTLPQGVTATGDNVITIDGTTYAAGSVTLSAPEGFTLENVIVNDESISGNTFTVNSDTKISADVNVEGDLDGGLKWKIANGTLTISGNGAIPDYYGNDNTPPWYSHRAEITSVVVESGVTSIGDIAFYSCTSLTTVTIPASVTEIESNAFLDCANLQTVNLTVPSGKTLIVEGEILSNGGDTVNLKSAIDANTNSVEIACVTIGTDGNDFGGGLKWIFSGGTLIISGNGNMPDFNSSTEQPWAGELVKKVIIGAGVTSIGESAFENCRNLSSVTIPDGVTSIGGNAFKYCENLQSVTIPAGVTSIGESAFYNCTSLTTITLPASVTFIGGSAFEGCNENLSVKVAVPEGKAVFINGTAYNADENGFADITAAAKNYTQFNLTYGEAVPEAKIEWEIADGVLTISGTGAMTDYNNNTNNFTPWYNRRSEITSVVIDSGITSIGDYAFYDLSNLQSVTIPAGVTSIGDMAFTYCKKLQSVTLPASVTSIGYQAFFDCENLESAVVTVPEGQHLVIGDEIRSDGGTVNVAEYVKEGVSVNFSASPVEEITYTDENGASKTVLAFALDGSTAELGGGTYVVKGNVTFDDGLTFKGDTKIILGEGATLTVNGDNGISIAGDLSIYGTGTLNATGNIHTQNDIIIADGTVTTAELKGYAVGIFGGKVTVSKVEAKSEILLDWKNTDDFISAGSYSSAYGEVYIGKNFYSGDTVYGGTEPAPAYISEVLGRQLYTLTADQIAALNGVKLNAFDYYTFSAPEGVDFTVSGETKTLGGVTYCKSGATVSVTAPEGKYLRGSDGKFFTGSKTFTVAGNIALTEPPTIGNLKLTVDADGNGTYELNTADQLVALSAYVNAGNDCKGMTFKLTTDIDMAGSDFAPIGQYDLQSASAFRGTFDGNGNAIRNLTINSEQITVGLFGYSQGLVQGVVLDNFNITGSLAVAGIVAYNSGVVMNCATLGGTISGGNDYSGTVVGMNVGIITGSYSYGELAAVGEDNSGESTVARIYLLDMPEGVTAQGALKFGGKYYAAADTTITLTADGELNNITVNGTPDSDGVFTVNCDTKILAEIGSGNEFNAAGTAVTVNGKRGDFHANSTLYSITASKENSTLIGNAKANQIIVAGGNENILTGGKGNDTFKFEAGGGIVTDYGIGATKGGDGKALATASGSDIVKVDGKVTGIYFDRDASTKKSATFTATIVYGDDQVVVLKDIAKKPTKTNSNPSKAIYQTNDVAAATLKIWDTSNTKQAVISATKLKKLFHDDSDDAFTGIIKEKTDYLVNLSEDKPNATNPFGTQLTFTGGKKD